MRRRGDTCASQSNDNGNDDGDERGTAARASWCDDNDDEEGGWMYVPAGAMSMTTRGDGHACQPVQ